MPPWARQAVDVAGEHDEAGRYAYPVVVVTVPRQSAKTTTVLDVTLGRGLVHRDYRCAYAAQTGHVTTERFGDRFAEVLAPGMLADRVRVRRSAGTERLTVTSTGSYVKAFPPLDGALRSSALDFVAVDEAQEHDDETLGKALDRTILPTFTTRPRRQLWVLGTAPALPGTMLERYYRLGQAGAPGVALVDYGATEDDDPDDPATWRARHPGLAAGLTDEAFLEQQLRHDRDGFVREHLNVWPKGYAGAVIPRTAYERATVDERPLEGAAGSPVLALDVAPGGRAAAIAAGWLGADGRPRAAVVQEADGTAWVGPALVDLVRRHRPRVVVADSVGQAAGVLEPLRRRLSTPVALEGFADVAAGCAWILEALVDPAGPRVALVDDEALGVAVSAATRRVVGDGGRWAWGRRSSGAPIHPLVAVTLAVWRVVVPPGEPFLV